LGLSAQNVASNIVAIVVYLTGVDETTLETLHARHVYNVEAFRFNVRFADMIDRSHPDRLIIDHRLLSHTTPIGSS
jgi:hypothetical protein